MGSSALTLYRTLLRSINCAFAGDYTAWSQARTRARQEFESNRLLTDQKKLSKQLEMAKQIAHILRHNIAQAHLRSADNVFEVKLDPGRHELGENQSRFVNGKKIPAESGCCGGGCGQ